MTLSTQPRSGQGPDDWGLAWESSGGKTQEPWTQDGRSSFQRAWDRYAGGFYCTCGCGGGFLAGHAGCLIAPSLAFVTAALGISVDKPLMIGTSLVITSAGVAAWYKFRGARASTLEKSLMVLSVGTGLALGIGPHLEHLDRLHDLMNAIGDPANICTTRPTATPVTPIPPQ